MSNSRNFEEKLRSAGLRPTRQRLEICEVLFDRKETSTLQLCKMVPDDCLVVSESGIYTPDDLKLLANANITTVPVGESLMRQQNLSEATKILLS